MANSKRYAHNVGCQPALEASARSCGDAVRISRRDLLVGSAASLALWGHIPHARAATTDPRLLTVVLRGALDGLAVAAPVGDPDYQELRGLLALPSNAALPLDNFFSLNPALSFIHSLYQKKQALIVHAVATPYRSRSHFDGQDVLESGLPSVGHTKDGWLNRALGKISSSRLANTEGLAMGPGVPLVMRGKVPVTSWSPRVLHRDIDGDTVSRLIDLYSQTDPKLASSLVRGMELDKMTEDSASKRAEKVAGGRIVRDMLDASEAAARLMSTADGPRIGALSVSGWDTHSNAGVMKGPLYIRLRGLDLSVKRFADKMGDAWKHTVIVIVTEFGRTARPNGSAGSDHGTGTIAMLLGGAVRGGRVIADWPGLKERDLFENRDLNPTVDLRGVLKGVLNQHLGLDHRILADTVFPSSAKVQPLDGLIG
jgi:uncharacterized protein (DUF1501 family)